MASKSLPAICHFMRRLYPPARDVNLKQKAKQADLDCRPGWEIGALLIQTVEDI